MWPHLTIEFLEDFFRLVFSTLFALGIGKQIETEDFAADVTYTLKMPEEQVAPFRSAAENLTNGQAQIERV